ncbi:MAG: hypothetical protein M3Z85_06200 [Acidobacteriota bacterium]|nr:hypothetical protein [Acidobacteriota bacterium]
MAETNGRENTRLDRIEEMIARQVLANEEAHDDFRADLKDLLRVQVLMSDDLSKMQAIVHEHSAEIASLAASQKHTGERVESLVSAIGEWIGRSEEKSSGLRRSVGGRPRENRRGQFPPAEAPNEVVYFRSPIRAAPSADALGPLYDKPNIGQKSS